MIVNKLEDVGNVKKKHDEKTEQKPIVMVLLLAVLFVQACNPASSAAPTSTQDQPDLVLATSTVEVPTSTPVPTPTFAIPVGFMTYQDAALNISVSIPETWVVTGIIEGQYAIFQSYPEDKYIGGEGLDPDDTKCDLNIRPEDESVSALIQTWKSAPMTTILSEEEIVMQSGQAGIRIEMDSLGRANSIITQINERVVVLTCFGNLEAFDEIAFTIRASE